MDKRDFFNGPVMRDQLSGCGHVDAIDIGQRTLRWPGIPSVTRQQFRGWWCTNMSSLMMVDGAFETRWRHIH
jgi:hypothetical protein